MTMKNARRGEVEAAEALPLGPTPGLAHPGRPGGLRGGGTGTCPLPLASWGVEPGGGQAQGCGQAGRQAPGCGQRAQVCGLDGPPSRRQPRPKPGVSLYPHPSSTPFFVPPKPWGHHPQRNRWPRRAGEAPPQAVRWPFALQCPHPFSQPANAPAPGRLGQARGGEGQAPQVRRWGQRAG